MPNDLPKLRTSLPGPRSIEAATRMRRVEACGVSSLEKGGTPVFWKKASGALIEDLDGNILLDCTSSFGVAGIGYCHPRLQSALQTQAGLLLHSMPGISPHAPYVDALESIAKSVGRWPQTEVILANTGSEAVEIALKISLRKTGKPGIISFAGAFHGQSIGALAVTSHNSLRNPFWPVLPHNAVVLPYPDPYRPAFQASSSTIAHACLEEVEELLRGQTAGGPPIGAVLIEPMQNAAGYIVPPKHFIEQLGHLCSTHGALLILDEVFTGFGRTGYWLAADRESVVPDLICIGKAMAGGLPAAACIASHETMHSLTHEGIIPLHGSTFVGNPLACIAIAETIHILEEETLISKALRLEETLKQRIMRVCERFDYVGEVRGLGAAIAIDFVTNLRTKKRDTTIAWLVMNALLKRGVVTLVTGLPYGNILAICPPFVISDSQCDYLLQAIESVLRDLQQGRLRAEILTKQLT